MIKMISSFIILLVVFTTSISFCQSQLFSGDGMGGYGNEILHFDSNGVNPPVSTPFLLDTIPIFRSSASLFDSVGNLSYITNGYYIFNGQGQCLNPSTPLNPSSLSSTFYPYGLPAVNSFYMLSPSWNTSLIYIIHAGIDVDVPFFGYVQYKPRYLYYTLVDKTLNNGNGGIVLINQVLVTDTLESGGIIVSRAANGKDWLIIAKKSNQNTFYKIALTENGIIHLPTQYFNNIPPVGFYGHGSSACNAEGTKLYFQSNYNYGILLNMDNCTGDLDSLRVIDIEPHNFSSASNSCAFSKSGQFLYVNTFTSVYQFDVTSPNITQSKILVDTIDSTQCFPNIYKTFNYMHRVVDDKIYISSISCLLYHILEAPDLPGTASNPSDSVLIISNVGANANNLINISPGFDSTCTITAVTKQEVGDRSVVYPNPASGEVNIKFDKQLFIAWKITDLTGRIIQTGKDQTAHLRLELSGYNPGPYVLEILSKDQIIFRNYIIKL